jgi:hypothetical protein
VANGGMKKVGLKVWLNWEKTVLLIPASLVIESIESSKGSGFVMLKLMLQNGSQIRNDLTGETPYLTRLVVKLSSFGGWAFVRWFR